MHEAAFSYCRVEWPPAVEHLGAFLFFGCRPCLSARTKHASNKHIKDTGDFRDREAQIIYLADRRFPAPELPEDPETGYGPWQFFDANHSIERTLRWPPARDKKGADVAL